jgi:ADP-heptose:LPS heptosyltransferase
MNILIIRRDNIGDLLLTTPLLKALKKQLKVKQLDILTNTYAAPVLRGNPFVDNLHTYQKLKHGHTNFLVAFIQRVYLILKLRKYHYDYILAFDHRAKHLARYLKKDFVLAPHEHWDSQSEVARVWALGKELGVYGHPGPLMLPPDLYDPVHDKRDKFSVGIHISARRVRQQFPVEKWIFLIRQMYKLNPKLQFYIFWSPGHINNPKHPGDDEKASLLKNRLRNIPIRFMPTPTLIMLIQSMKICGSMVMVDGGAMHIAAALNIPIVALFGDSNPKRWHPWGVSYKILSAHSQDVKDIKVPKILKAWSDLVKFKNNLNKK